MPRGRKKGDHDSRRVQIAEAACKVFLKLGLTRTSLIDIAQEMGNTTGVLRHYFSDKDELLLYAKNMLFDRTHEKAGIVAKGYEGLGKVRAIAAGLLPADKESIDSYKLLAMFNGSSIGDPRLMRLQHQRNDRHAKLLAEVIAGLQKDGHVPKELNPKIEACGILAFVDGLAEQQIMRPQPWSREILNGLLDGYIDGLTRPRTGFPRR